MKEAFEKWSPRAETLMRVKQCIDIVEEYERQGFRLTLRQLYYQLVSRDMIPNTERSYKNLGTVLSKARLAGWIDWDAIEDRGRQPNKAAEWPSIRSLVESALRAYRLPRWEGQAQHAELWVEKEALAGVLEPMARKYHVTLMVNKGYSSQSAMYQSAQRIEEETSGGDIPAVIFYLGDLDPSGEDMVRDVGDRLRKFTRHAIDIEVIKLALTPEQVEEYEPPPNPTKLTDSRAEAYIARHGMECWEVDALDPATLQGIITTAFEEIVDQDMMDEIMEREEKHKSALRKAAAKIQVEAEMDEEDSDEDDEEDEDE